MSRGNLVSVLRKTLHRAWLVPYLAGCIVVLSWVNCAHASDKALAEVLYSEAKELMAAGEVAAACDKFAASNREDPSSGTSLNLARCFERQGKSASAWAQYREAARIARVQGREDRIVEATKRAEELKPRLSYLTVEVAEPASGILVRRGATELPHASWGLRIPVDPGVHAVTAKAPGHHSYHQDVQVSPDGDRQTVRIPRLKLESADSEPVSSSGAPAIHAGADSAKVDEGDVAEPKHKPLTAEPSHTLAYVLGGGGALLTAAGFAVGFIANSTYQEARRKCGATFPQCIEPVVKIRENAELQANVGNALAVVGVGSVLVATWLYLADGESEHGGTADRAASRAPKPGWALTAELVGFGYGRALLEASF